MFIFSHVTSDAWHLIDFNLTDMKPPPIFRYEKWQMYFFVYIKYNPA